MRLNKASSQLALRIIFLDICGGRYGILNRFSLVGSLFDLGMVLFSGATIVFDMSQRRIPNWLVLAGMIGGIAFSYFQGLPHVYESLLGLVIGIGVLVVPFALGWMGAGDVKLFGAMGALLGVRLLPRVFFYTALCGLVFALAIIVAKRMKIDIRAFARMATDCWRLFMSRGNVLPATVAERVASGSYGLPYGVAIALGALVARYGDPAGRWAGF